MNGRQTHINHNKINLFILLILGDANGETNEKLMDQTIVPLETYHCINFHLLSDHLN